MWQLACVVAEFAALVTANIPSSGVNLAQEIVRIPPDTYRDKLCFFNASTIDSDRICTRCKSFLPRKSSTVFADEKMSSEVPSSSLAVMSSKWVKLEFWAD